MKPSSQITKIIQQTLDKKTLEEWTILQPQLEQILMPLSDKNEADGKLIAAEKAVKKSNIEQTLATKATAKEIVKAKTEIAKKAFKEAKALIAPLSLSAETIIAMLQSEMITSQDMSVEDGLEQLLIDKLVEIIKPSGDEHLNELFKDMAIAAVASPLFKGHGYFGDHFFSAETYNKQEQRALKCLKHITDPKISLALFKNWISQATDSKRLSGLVSELSTKIIGSVFEATFSAEPDPALITQNVNLLNEAINMLIPVISKIPVWSKSSDASLMAYFKTLENMFSTTTNLDADPMTVLYFFATVHQLKLDTLNMHKNTPRPLPDKVANIIKTCEDVAHPIYQTYYAHTQLTQEQLTRLVASLLSVTNNPEDTEGNARLTALRARITDNNLLFRQLMERLETHTCSGVNEEFLAEYISPLTPEQVLLTIAHLCVEAKPGNGNAHRTVLSLLAKKIELIPDLYIENRIRNISMTDEQEVKSFVHCLATMNHRLYPEAVLSLANYFYRKSASLKADDEQLRVLENALTMIFKANCSSDYAANLKDSIVAAYGNHFFPNEQFMQASEVFAFLGLEIENTEGLTFEWLKNIIEVKLASEQKSAMEAIRVRMVTGGMEASAPTMILSTSQVASSSQTANQVLQAQYQPLQPQLEQILSRKIKIDAEREAATKAEGDARKANVPHAQKMVFIAAATTAVALKIAEAENALAEAKALLAPFSEAQLIAILRNEMITSANIVLQNAIERVFIDRLAAIINPTDKQGKPLNEANVQRLNKVLKDLALASVSSSLFTGHGYFGDHDFTAENYNKQEQRALKCIELITDPKICLDLFRRFLGQATDSKRLSGLASELSTKIIGSVISNNDNIQLVQSAFNLMIPMVSKIPVWSKSNDASLMAYLKTLQMLFFAIRNYVEPNPVTGYQGHHVPEYPTIVRTFFITVHQLKLDTLNWWDRLVSSQNNPQNAQVVVIDKKNEEEQKKVINLIKECEKHYLAELYRVYYENPQTPLTQEELMELVAGLLSVNSHQEDSEGRIRTRDLLAKVTDRNLLFKALIKRLETHDCNGMNEEFVAEYINSFTPQQALLEVAPLCMKAKAGNGNAHRVVLTILAKRIEFLPDAYLQDLIRNITIENEESVTQLVECLISMDHRLYPETLVFSAEYFYGKSAVQKEETEQLRALENALKMVLKLKTSSEEIATLENKIVVAYGNLLFPGQGFKQAEAVFAFVGLVGITDTKGLTFQWLQTVVHMTQSRLVIEKGMAREAHHAAIAEQTAQAAPKTMGGALAELNDLLAALEEEEPVRFVVGEPQTVPPPAIIWRPMQEAVTPPPSSKDSLNKVLALITTMRSDIYAGKKEALEQMNVFATIANTQPFNVDGLRTIIETFEEIELLCKKGKDMKLNPSDVLGAVTAYKKTFSERKTQLEQRNASRLQSPSLTG